MSTGYGWEGIRQVYATLLGARHVPEHFCRGACLQRGAITSVQPLPLPFFTVLPIPALQHPPCTLSVNSYWQCLIAIVVIICARIGPISCNIEIFVVISDTIGLIISG